MHELIKKLLIALPFALAILIFAKIIESVDLNTGAKISYITSGLYVLIIFGCLLFQKPDWKLLVIVVMIPAIGFASLLRSEASEPGTGILKEYLFLIAFIFICIISISNFFMLYIYKLRHTGKADLKVIFIRSTRFSIAVGIFLIAYLMLNNTFRKSEDSFAVQLLLYLLPPVVFFILCYIFDLFPLERKKNTRSSELRKELEDVYLEERKKLEKKA